MPLTLSRRAQVVPQVKISPPDNFALDNFVARPAATFNLRKTTRHYDGTMIIVRGTTSSTLQREFKSDIRGDLDIRALLAFIGNGSGFVVRWNNPNNSARDATQATTARQPRIAHNGVLDLANGKPCMRQIATVMWLDLPNIMVGASSATAAAVYRQSPDSIISQFGFNGWGNVNGDTDNVHSPWMDGLGAFDSFCSVTRQLFSGYNEATRAVLRTHTMRQTGTALQCFRNGIQIDTDKTVAFKTTPLNNKLLNGSQDNSALSEDSLCEAVFFASAISTADRLLLDNNQKAYYGIS